MSSLTYWNSRKLNLTDNSTFTAYTKLKKFSNLIEHHFTIMTKFQNVFFLGFIYCLYCVLHQALQRRSGPPRWNDTRQLSIRSLCLFLGVVHCRHVRIRERQTQRGVFNSPSFDSWFSFGVSGVIRVFPRVFPTRVFPYRNVSWPECFPTRLFPNQSVSRPKCFLTRVFPY